MFASSHRACWWTTSGQTDWWTVFNACVHASMRCLASLVHTHVLNAQPNSTRDTSNTKPSRTRCALILTRPDHLPLVIGWVHHLERSKRVTTPPSKVKQAKPRVGEEKRNKNFRVLRRNLFLGHSCCPVTLVRIPDFGNSCLSEGEVMKRWFGYGWAQQPVTSRVWAFIASLLFAVSRLTGFRVLSTAKHIAWCRAGGRSWRPA